MIDYLQYRLFASQTCNQARRDCNSASNELSVAAVRGAIEHQYVKRLSGWSPRYVPDSLLREAATRLQDRFLFGSDYPFITPQRWLKEGGYVVIPIGEDRTRHELQVGRKMQGKLHLHNLGAVYFVPLIGEYT